MSPLTPIVLLDFVYYYYLMFFSFYFSNFTFPPQLLDLMQEESSKTYNKLTGETTGIG